MNRLRLAALILTAGLGFVSGCSACYSLGRPNGGGFLGLGGHRMNGTSTVSALPECCPTVGCAPDCGPTCLNGGLAAPGPGGPYLMPQEGLVAPPAGIPVMPGAGGVPIMPGPAGVPNVAPPPLLTEPPLGSNTKLSPVPQSIPFPYSPVGY